MDVMLFSTTPKTFTFLLIFLLYLYFHNKKYEGFWHKRLVCSQLNHSHVMFFFSDGFGMCKKKNLRKCSWCFFSQRSMHRLNRYQWKGALHPFHLLFGSKGKLQLCSTIPFCWIGDWFIYISFSLPFDLGICISTIRK